MPLSEAPLRIRDRLAGHHILVTGSTGFLAKVFLEKLLRSVDTIAGLHLLVRPRAGGPSAEQRVAKQVLSSHAFDRLRAGMGDRFSPYCAQKIHVVSGDLTQERFGLDPDQYKALAERITLVVNCAATVTFDERLDLAISLNALGPSRLLDFAKACGNVRFLHVSTCYVCGARRGTVIEDFSAPQLARESLPRDPATGAFDLDALLDSMQAESAEICERLGSDTETGRQKLIELGMQCARRHGWNDTYTFTKWIGEQLLVRDRGDVSLAIFRPAIIESSFQEPTPGWIDGLRMADPMIVAYGRGKLGKFPGAPEVAVDLIPADFVANAMIATLPDDGRAPGRAAVYQCGSSERNPLYARELTVLLHRAFLKRPMIDDTGKPVHPSIMKLVDSELFLIGLRRKRRLILWLRRLLKPFRWARRRVRRLSVLARQVEQLLYLVKIYSPYTSLDCRFADDALRSVAQSLHPDDQRAFPFDMKQVDWGDYIVDRHVPGVRSFVLGSGSEPSPRISAVDELGRADATVGAEAFQAENLFDVFARTAGRFPDKPALQVRRLNKWVCYTYDETLRASGTVMRRFLERGLAPGDRIAICAEGGPEWGLTYLAAMRAGLTVIPLDPQLPPADAWDAARFAEAKLMCASPATAKGLLEMRREADPDVVVMTKPFIPPPAASQDLLPDPVPVAGDAIASILFTSGTTIAPKAVPLTHRNFIANASALLRVHPALSTDEFLSVLPTYHAFEFTGGFLIPLASGATITYLDQLKGTEIQAAMCATGTTVMLVVPRLLRMFHDGIKRGIAAGGLFQRSLFRVLVLLSELTGRRFARTLFGPVHKRFGGRLRMLFCGGSRLDPELLEAFERWGFRVYEGYGLTETSPVLSVSPPGAGRAGSVGPVLPNVDLEIRNPNLQDIGEVWVKGPTVMSGYLNNPKATAEVIVDGWFKTGDLGRRDSDGYLHLTGRSKDLIITGAGKNVYPDEVELRYRDLPSVKEMCVFGMPSSDGLGDAVHAVIVPDDAAHELDPSSIEREIRLEAEAISESLPPHERIAVLHFWTRELPKTSTLKAKRNLIREMIAQGVGVLSHRPSGATEDKRKEGAPADSSGSELTPESWAALGTILSRQSGQAATEIKSSTHLLLDLGIDSVGKIDILGMIETQFDMTIDDETAAKIARVGDLIHLLVDRTPKTGAVMERGAWRRRLALDPGDTPTNGRLPVPLLPIRWLVRGGVAAFMSSYVRVRVEGLNHIPATGAFILAPNHASHLDTPSVLTAIGGRRRVWVAGAADYFFDTRFRRFLFGRILDTISFDRQADGIRGLRRCGESLRRGDGLLIFPEGTRSMTGTMHPFKIGVAVLAVEQGVPIVPVYIHKTFDLFRKGQRVVRPGTVGVTFGAPIAPSPMDGDADHYAAFCALTRQVEAAVTAMGEEVSA